MIDSTKTTAHLSKHRQKATSKNTQRASTALAVRAEAQAAANHQVIVARILLLRNFQMNLCLQRFSQILSRACMQPIVHEVGCEIVLHLRTLEMA